MRVLSTLKNRAQLHFVGTMGRNSTRETLMPKAAGILINNQVVYVNICKYMEKGDI